MQASGDNRVSARFFMLFGFAHKKLPPCRKSEADLVKSCGPQVIVKMIMERLSSALSPALSTPVLIALLVGLAFLQALSRPWLGTHKSRHRTESKAFDLGPAQEGNEIVVSKESDFPEDWWTGSNVFELERRAIFGKVCFFSSTDLY